MDGSCQHSGEKAVSSPGPVSDVIKLPTTPALNPTWCIWVPARDIPRRPAHGCSQDCAATVAA